MKSDEIRTYLSYDESASIIMITNGFSDQAVMTGVSNLPGVVGTI